MAGDFSDLESFPAQWPLIRIGEFAEVKGGKRLPAGTALIPNKTDHPYIRIVDFKHGKIDKSALQYVPDDVFPRIARYTISSKDVYVSIVGTIGLVGVIDEDLDGANLTENAAKICSLSPEVDRDYLTAFLSSGWGQHQIRALTVGSTQPKLALFRIADIRVPIPPIHEQRLIAQILGSLDDKIELNRRMAATLEEMARALFKSWFVDFDPVRAKAEGRPTGLPPDIDALFPDEVVESELGKIPKGWKVSTIGARLTTALGGTPSRAKAEYWTDGTVPWINSGKTNEFRIIEPSEWITKEALANSATKLLPKRTTVLAITGATLGQVSITEFECCANQSVVAILASVEFPTEFIYHWIKENIAKLVASQTGGAQQHINKGNVEELALLCPEQRIVSEYANHAKPMFDQIAANCFQARTLVLLRDILLPKLMSGEIKVREIENFAEGMKLSVI